MKKYLEALLYPTHFNRFIFFLFFDIFIIISSLYLAFNLRFEFALAHEYKRMIIYVLPLFLIVKLIVFAGFRMYKITWRYVGINDFCNIVGAIITAESILMVLILLSFPWFFQFLQSSYFSGFPRSIFLIDGVVSLLFASGIRISKRLYLEVIRKKHYGARGKRTIIIGADNIGEMIIRDIARQGFSVFYPIGLLDDDIRKVGAYVHGVKVLNTTDKLKDIILKNRAEAVIIAIPFISTGY